MTATITPRTMLNMREWHLTPGSPYTLSLAADYRLSETDYTNDQIWDLLLGTGDLPALLLQTSYGLRARNMRVFPRFIEGDKSATDPSKFETPPTIKKFHPNYVLLTFSPFPGIIVDQEIWAADSQTISGRVGITNNGVTARAIRLEWVALLHGAGKDHKAMRPTKKEAVTVLEGHTENLSPVLFLTGGAAGYTSPYSALVHELNLLPSGARRFTWVLASKETPDESFNHARSIATRNWNAEIARIEMTNASQLEIHTGDLEWDAAFAFGQTTAQSLLLSKTAHLPYGSFVANRRPDQGYSTRGDGSDYNHLWNGQTAINTWYLCQFLLPGSPQAAKDLLTNFISTQNEEGHIDWKPGLGGQRSRMLATPILVSLAWNIYQQTEDIRFLNTVFSPLLNFTHYWFTNANDRDGDGIPEWANGLQTGFDSNPSFSRWQNWSQAADIRFVESPDLCAYLFRECQLLIKMAKLLDRPKTISPLEALSQKISRALNNAWDARRATYHYWDRETHQSPQGETLKKRKGNGALNLDVVFEYPRRLMLRFETKSDIVPNAEATVTGTLPNGKKSLERIGKEKIVWIEGLGTATLEQAFAELEHIQIDGMPEDGTTSINIIDFLKEDMTLLLPLWAGVPEASRAKKIIKRKLSAPKQYQRLYGIPASRKPPKSADEAAAYGTWLPWNMMIGEGMLAYGAKEETVNLIKNIMTGIIQNLKREQTFRKHYHVESGKGLGDKNSAAGLPPVGLFLETLGVRISSPWKVYIHGLNPFDWDIKLKYQGLMIDCLPAETIITFPNGKSISVTDSRPSIVDGNIQISE
ncbi:MAG: hypothetical protein N2D54_08125 [Chloroflexota bacterium]